MAILAGDGIYPILNVWKLRRNQTLYEWDLTEKQTKLQLQIRTGNEVGNVTEVVI